MQSTRIALLAVSFVTAAACGSGSGVARDSAAATIAPASATSAAASAAPGTAATAPGSVPASVDALGHHGENAYDMVKLGDWIKARASADSLRPTIDSIPASATSVVARQSDVKSAFDTLDRAISRKDRRAALRASNRLTQLGALLSAPFHPQVPAEVMLLDHDGRELEIWAAAGDRARLREAALTLRNNWTAVRPQVVARGGGKEAAAFDALVVRVESATTPADYARVATPVLDAVDTLEQVFTR
jgi:hypothetical protein